MDFPEKGKSAVRALYGLTWALAAAVTSTANVAADVNCTGNSNINSNSTVMPALCNEAMRGRTCRELRYSNSNANVNSNSNVAVICGRENT